MKLPQGVQQNSRGVLRKQARKASAELSGEMHFGTHEEKVQK